MMIDAGGDLVARSPLEMERLMAKTRVSHDRPVTANIASREHYLQYGVRRANS